MEHEPLGGFLLDIIDPLLVFHGSQGCGNQGLRLTSSEKGRPMSSRKQSRFDADGPYLIRPAPIGPFRFGEDDIAHLVAFDLKPGAVLREIQTEAVANDVIFGVMGATILK